MEGVSEAQMLRSLALSRCKPFQPYCHVPAHRHTPMQQTQKSKGCIQVLEAVPSVSMLWQLAASLYLLSMFFKSSGRIWQTHSIMWIYYTVHISQWPTLTLILVSEGGPSAPRANDFFRFSLTSVSLSSSSTLSSSFCLHSVSSSANRCSTPWPAHSRSQHWYKSYVWTVLCVWVVSDLWRSSSPPSPPSSPCGGKSVHS